MTRRRLEPQQRREELLDAGAALFAEASYEGVFVEDIAARAGVSRSLLYRYFPSKRDLYVAILRRAGSRFPAGTSLDTHQPLEEQLAVRLNALIQSVVDHPFEAVEINHGALSGDPTIQAILVEELSLVSQRLIDQLAAEQCRHETVEIALEGWLAFVRVACVKWVQSPNISRGELNELCLRTFDCVLGDPVAARGAGYAGCTVPADQFALLHTDFDGGGARLTRNLRPIR